MHWNLQQKESLGNPSNKCCGGGIFGGAGPTPGRAFKVGHQCQQFHQCQVHSWHSCMHRPCLGWNHLARLLDKETKQLLPIRRITSWSPVRRSTEFSRPCRSCHSFHSQNSPDNTNLAAIHLFAHVNISPDFNLKIWLGQNHTLLFADQINNSISATWLRQSLRAQLIPPKPEPHLPAMSTGLCRNFPRNSSAEDLLTDFSFSYFHHLYPRNLQQDPLKNHP